MAVSGDNIDVVRRGAEARSAGRFGEWIDTLDPNIEWDISGYPLPDFPERGSGRDLFIAHVTKYWSRWNDYAQTVERTIEAGDDEPTKPQLDVFQMLSGQLEEQLKKWAQLKKEDVAKGTELLADDVGLATHGRTSHE